MLRDLPSTRTGILPVTGWLPRTSVPRDLSTTQQLHCGRGQLPQSRACGARQHAADTAAAREPFVVPPGQSGMEKKSAAEKYSPTTWIFSVPGSLARELPKG